MASEPTASEGAASWSLVVRVSTEAMVESRFPVVGKMRRIARLSSRGGDDSPSDSTVDASTDDESTEDESTEDPRSDSVAVGFGAGIDAIRSFVGEFCERRAPLRLRVGLDVNPSSFAPGVSAVSLDTTVDVSPTGTFVSIWRFARRFGGLRLPWLFGAGSSSGFVFLETLEVLISDSACRGSSSVETDSLDVRLLRGPFSVKGSGVV